MFAFFLNILKAQISFRSVSIILIFISICFMILISKHFSSEGLQGVTSESFEQVKDRELFQHISDLKVSSNLKKWLKFLVLIL